MLDIVIVVAAIVFLVCFIIVLRKAFKDSPVQAALCFFVPLYVVYYAFARLESEKKNQLGAVLVVSLLLSAGLSLVSEHYAEAEVDDACKFLAKSDVEEVLGEKVGEGQRALAQTEVGKAKLCSYDAIEHPQRSVAICFYPKRTALEPMNEVFREKGKPVRWVNGIGREALWSGSALYVRTKDSCFFVGVQDTPEGLSPDAQLEADKMLAQKAIHELSGSP